MKIRNLRRYILVVLMLGIAINYLDRQALPLLKEILRDPVKGVGLTDESYGFIMAVQSFVYALAFIPTGRFVDMVGTRRGYAALIVEWSVAALMHAFARTRTVFATMRGFLAFGEAGAWPAGTRATAEWFPPHERSAAVGLWNAGSSIGAIIASLFILDFLLKYTSWRGVFVVTSSLGFLWLIVWLIIYRRPSEHPWVTDEERDYITVQKGGSEGASVEDWDGAPGTFGQLLQHRQTWAIFGYRLCMDQTWWFYVIWMVGYFKKMGIAEVGHGWLYALPYTCAFTGGVAGGWLASALIRAGWSTTAARKTMIVGGCALMAVGALIPSAKTAILAASLVGVAAFGYTAASSNLLSIPADVAPRKLVATLNGISGFAGGMGGAVMNLAVGAWVGAHGYSAVFTTEAFVPLIGAIIVLTVLGKVRPLGMRAAPQSAAPVG